MTNWLLSLLMLAALAGVGDQLRTQDRDQLKDGTGVNCTCPCK